MMRPQRLNEKMKDVTVMAYQCAGLHELRNMIIVAEQTCFCHPRDPTKIIKTMCAYFSYPWHLKTKDSEIITSYKLLQRISDTKSVALNQQTKKIEMMKIDVIQEPEPDT